MGHRLILGATIRRYNETPIHYHQAQCSCGEAGPPQAFASEAYTDAKVHAAIHDALLPKPWAP